MYRSQRFFFLGFLSGVIIYCCAGTGDDLRVRFVLLSTLPLGVQCAVVFFLCRVSGLEGGLGRSSMVRYI